MGMLKDFWDISKDILNQIVLLKQQPKEKRKALSELFEHIGTVLKDTHDKLSANNYPNGNCEQLKYFSNKLHQEMIGVIDPIEADKLCQRLINAHEVEKLYYYLQDGEENKTDLILLDKASGHFIAASKQLLIW